MIAWRRLEEEDDDEYEQKLSWLPLPMSSLVGGGLKDGMVITVFDFSQVCTMTAEAPTQLQRSRAWQPRRTFALVAAAVSVAAAGPDDPHHAHPPRHNRFRRAEAPTGESTVAAGQIIRPCGQAHCCDAPTLRHW